MFGIAPWSTRSGKTSMKPSSIAAPGECSNARSGSRYATTATAAMIHQVAGASTAAEGRCAAPPYRIARRRHRSRAQDCNRARLASMRVAVGGRLLQSGAWPRSPRSRRSTGSKRAGRRCGRNTAPTGSTARARARRDLLDRHAAADGERLAAHGFGLRLRADRFHRALPAHARPARLLPDGLGRQRPAHRAPRAELLRRALRTAPAVRPRVRPAREAGQGRRADLAAELPRAVRAAGRGGRSRVRGAVAPARAVGRLEPDLHDRRARGAAHESARVPAQPRARRGVPGRPRRRSGTSTSALRSRRPSSRTARCRARTTRCASTRPTVPATCSSTRPGPSCSPRASQSSPIPTTPATSRCSAPKWSRRCTACACRSSRTTSPIPRREPASR